ncbi:hypothetical protein, partial [Kribbella catacumbae]|uniref:hypothetical protein n=1 Tax=Kribbella catacumbae TaxID=460086 RepID=UPI001ED9C5FF
MPKAPKLSKLPTTHPSPSPPANKSDPIPPVRRYAGTPVRRYGCTGTRVTPAFAISVTRTAYRRRWLHVFAGKAFKPTTGGLEHLLVTSNRVHLVHGRRQASKPTT